MPEQEIKDIKDKFRVIFQIVVSAFITVICGVMVTGFFYYLDQKKEEKNEIQNLKDRVLILEQHRKK